MPRSNRGNKFILVVVDVATRMVFLRGLKDKSMYSIAQKLLRLFCDVGFPRILGSDNGTEFNNQLLDAVKKISKIDSRFIAPYHHRSNGIVERTIRTVADAIYKQLEGLISQWDDYMPSTQYYLNTRVLELHGSSPYSLLYARQPNDLADYTNDEAVIESDQDRQHRLAFLNTIVYPTILEKVNKKQAQRNEKFIASHRMLKGDYPTGSQVMIRDEMRADAPSPRYEGPFTVMRRESSGNYRLKGADGTEYSRPPQVLKLASMGIAKDLLLPNTIFAAVQEIVEHKEMDNEIYYRTRWKGHGQSQDSWLRQEDFLDYGPIQKYELGGQKEKESKEVGLQPNLKVARAGQKKMVRFDQSTKGSGLGFITGQDAATVAKAGQAGQITGGGTELPAGRPVVGTTGHESVKTMEVLLDLDGEQQDAVGAYWKSMRASRKRKESIIESDSDEETKSKRRVYSE